MISRIIKDEVCVIHRSRRLKWITQTEALIILDIMRKPNSIIVLLCIQNAKSSTILYSQYYIIRYSFCFSCKYSSKIPLTCFVALFVQMLSFSDSKVEISSVFNDVNRLKAILFTFQKYSVLAGLLASCRPCWRLGFDSVQ